MPTKLTRSFFKVKSINVGLQTYQILKAILQQIYTLENIYDIVMTHDVPPSIQKKNLVNFKLEKIVGM